MTRSRLERHCAPRTITPPRRGPQGGVSPAWLLLQAAQLSWEVRAILQLINGMRLNLSEELRVHAEASDMLLNAAHATAVMEARLPLAPAWGNGPPRVRSIFAQAREAGTEPGEVRPGLDIFRPPIDPQIKAEMQAAWRADDDPDAQCAGTTLKHQRCAKTIVSGIGADHCASHLTPAERQRRDVLRAAQARHGQAVQDAQEEQRVHLAVSWADRYGRRPDRLELPAPPLRPRTVAPLDGDPGLVLDQGAQAMLAFYDSGWPLLCPRSAEIIGALSTCPLGTVLDLAELASFRSPERWSCGEEWLASSIWDGIQPPALTLPAPGTAPELDEHPAIQSLRRHLADQEQTWQRWSAGFATLVEACDDPPIDTMAELLAFWQDLGVLVATDNGTDDPLWSLPPLPPSPWRVLYSRGHLVPPAVLAATLDYLLDSDVPLDDELTPSDLFHVIMAAPAGEEANAEVAALSASASS